MMVELIYIIYTALQSSTRLRSSMTQFLQLWLLD